MCHKEFGSLYYLKYHVRAHHTTGDKDEEADTFLEQLSRNECHICKLVCSTSTELKSHVTNIHQQETEFKCPLCLLEFSWKCALEAHLQVIHSNDRQMYPCSICDKEFTQASYIKTHVKTVHLNVKDMKCLECPKVYTTSSSLMQHVKYVHRCIRYKVRRYMCSFSGKRFHGPSAVRRHVRSVHYEKKEGVPIFNNLACNTCGKLFSNPNYLRNHMAYFHEVYKGSEIPLAVRKFKCDSCGCYLKGRYALRKHMSHMHSDKLFPCSVCDKSFTNSERLLRHIVSIH